MKFKSFLIMLLGVSLFAHAQNTAKTSVTTNIVDQGSRGITAAKMSVTMNAIIDWATSPALKRVTITQLRAITTDWPNVLHVTDGNGLFTLDATDVSTSDDGTNTLVTTSGLKRYKRVILSVATISGLQAALDLKAPLANPTFTGTVTVPNISANGATISPTELSYIDNLSSNAQTQISAKLPLSGGNLTGGLIGTTATFSGKGVFSDTVRSDVGLKSKANFIYERQDALNTDLYSWTMVSNGAGAGQSLKLAYSSQRTSGGAFNPNVLYVTDGQIGVMKTGPTKTLDISGTLGVSGNVTLNSYTGIVVGNGASTASAVAIGSANTLAKSNGSALSFGQLVNAEVSNSANIDATKLATGTVNNTKFGYLANASGVTGGSGSLVLSTNPTLAGATLSSTLNGTNAIFTDTVRSDVGLKSKANFIYERQDALNTDLYSWTMVSNGAGAGQSLKLAYSSQRTSGGAFNPNVLYITDGKIGVMKTSPNYTIDVSGTLGVSSNIGIGTTTSNVGYNLKAAANITGATSSYGIESSGTVQSDVTTLSSYYRTVASTQAASFTLPTLNHFSATQGVLGAGSTVTSQMGFLAGSSLIGATNNYAFYGNIPAGAGRYNIYMNGTADNYMSGRLGLGNNFSLTSATFNNSLNLSGGTTAYGNYSNGIVQSDATGAAYYNVTNASTAANSFTVPNLMHYVASQGTIGAGSTVTTQTAFFVSSNLTGASTNIGFRGQIASSSGRWNIYMDGTADNYLAGSLGIGSTTVIGHNLNVSKNVVGNSGTGISIRAQGNIQSDVTAGYYFRSDASTQATSFTLTDLAHYAAIQGTIGAGSTVTNQYGFNVNNTLTGATNNYGFYGNIAAGTGRWNFYGAGTANNFMNGRLGLGTTTLTSTGFNNTLAVTGSTNSFANASSGIISSDVTANGIYYNTSANTQAASFTLTNLIHYAAQQGTIGAGSTVTNQFGVWVGSSLTGAANNYGVYSGISSSTGRWNFYAAGDANNYFSGNIGIGSGKTVPTAALDVNGVILGNSDIESSDSAKGLILKSPNGTRWRIQVNNSGVLTTTSL